MHICFVNPPLATDDLYAQWDLSGVDSICPPLGLLILAAEARRAGHQVSLVDAYAHGFSADAAARKIASLSPDVVGFTATTPAIFGAGNTALLLRPLLPQALFLLGGAHVTAVSEETLRMFPIFDYAVLGEGENTLLEILGTLEKDDRSGLDQVAGLAFLREQAYVVTEPRDLIKNLDQVPYPAWDLLPNLFDPYRMSIVGTTSNKSTAIFTSRGCPGICSFCDTSVFGRRFRGHSSDYVLGMIDVLVKDYGVEDFLVYDDNFVVNKTRLSAICEGIIARGYDIQWSCCARVNLISPEMLALMRKAGCWQIEYGIESGCPDILHSMNKQITLEQVRSVLKMTKRAGIMTRGNFIIGYPGETRESMHRTLDFLLGLDLDYFQQTFFTPYPGAAASAIAKDFGTVCYDWRQLNNVTINFIPDNLTEKDLVTFSKKAFLRFYLRPKVLFQHLKRLTSPSMFVRYVKMSLAYLKTVLR
jgi:radical SAM superfamily enzyme YgiQ (UPF0313 family)